MPKEPETRTTTMPSTVDPKGVPPAISDEIVDQLLAGYKKPEDLLGPGGLIKQLMGRLITRAMNAEMSHHLGYEHGQAPPEGQDNRRNGRSSKTLRTDAGPVEIEVPRDRQGNFEPRIVGKHDRPWFNRPIFGLVRPMSRASTAKKFDSKSYIAQHRDSADRLF